jgi:choline dehydrogenase-like flavoprotein
MLAEAGLSVLALDAGWRGTAASTVAISVLTSRLAEPELLSALPPAVVQQGARALKLVGRVRQPVQSKCFAWPLSPASFVDDRDFPYILEPGSQFDWFRTHQLGGRMTVPGHGRQYNRMSPVALAKWPISLQEFDKWYRFVEQRLGLTGRAEDDVHFRGSRVVDEIAASASEEDTIERISRRRPDALIALGRFAPPLRAIELAARTGRLSCVEGAVVRHVDVDAAGRTAGVTWVDRASGSLRSAKSPLVFLCASTLETTRILLSSRSARCPDGLGGRSGVLGRYLMDHVVVSGEGVGPIGTDDCEMQVPGRCLYLPLFGHQDEPGNERFHLQVYRWSVGRGVANFAAVSFSEMQSRPENRVVLDTARTDTLGNPILRIACTLGVAEHVAAARQAEAIRDLSEALDVKLCRIDEVAAPPGTAMHECGTARMGDSPQESVLDPNNECWDAKGLYVTDGAAFPTQGLAHPTLTIMALTARACAHASGTASCRRQPRKPRAGSKPAA